MILVPLFDLKFLTEVAAGGCRNFKSAALVRLQVILVILVPKCCLFATVAGPIRGREGQYRVAAGGVRRVDQFKSISKQLNTATPAPGAGVVRHDRRKSGAYWRYCWMRVVRRPARPCWSIEYCHDKNSSTVSV